MIAHILALYLLPAAVMVIATRTRRRRGDPPATVRELAGLWPFPVLAALEACFIDFRGNLLAEWALPTLATAYAMAVSRSPEVVWWARRAMVVVASGLLIHGHALMNQGYTTRPDYHSPRISTYRQEHAEWGWMTPLNGMRYRLPDAPEGEVK